MNNIILKMLFLQKHVDMLSFKMIISEVDPPYICHDWAELYASILFEVCVKEINSVSFIDNDQEYI